ncbi:hypothetical protein [Halohasta salina]|uniref:hypothetical protein n=1 Tax=Halohasta salina TaxID=2961621 RepID=UPI0020A462C0|nr:hypothetical protein [Halohasta salina]
MTRSFSNRLVGVAILGVVLSLFRFWLPALFGLLGDVRWGGGFVIVAGIEAAADLVVALTAVGVLSHAVDGPGGLRSTGILTWIALVAAVGVLMAIALLRIGPYRLVAPLHPVLYPVRVGGLAVLVGTIVVGWFYDRGVDTDAETG